MTHFHSLPVCAVLLLAAMLPAPSGATSVTVRVTVENHAPAGGTFLTPPWIAFHDGAFDLYNQGESVGDGALPAGLESLAEDGATMSLSSDFGPASAGGVDGTLPGPIPPGEARSMEFTVDGALPANRFLSYASMVIPSNDAFIANRNPMAHAIFDESGNFVGADFIVLGSAVLNAGTEVNDELPANTAFFGQMTPNTGVDENGVVAIHSGFMPPGSGGILDDDMFANADFTAAGYEMARITVVLVNDVDVTTVSAVSNGPIVAPDSIAAGWGTGFTTETSAAASLPLPTSLGGIQLTIVDSKEGRTSPGIYLASPGQINFLVSSAAALGKGRVSISGGEGDRTGDVLISNVAPALISINGMGTGTAAGQVVRVNGGTVAIDETVDSISVGEQGTAVYLMLYGTGIRNHSANPVQALVNGVKVPVLYADTQEEFPGLDQVNLGPLPVSLAGSGTVNIELFVDGAPANVVTATFQ